METERPSLVTAPRERRDSFEEDPIFPALAALERVLGAGAAARGSGRAVDDILAVGAVAPLAAPTLASSYPTVKLVAHTPRRTLGLSDPAARRALRAAAVLLVGAVVVAFLARLVMAHEPRPASRPVAAPVVGLAPTPVPVTYVTPEPPAPVTPPAVTESLPTPPPVGVRVARPERATVHEAPTRRSRRHASRARSTSPAPAARGAVSRPELPERATVFASLQGASAHVRACGRGQGGEATVHLTFASTGRVTTARVVGLPPGPVATCVVSAVRRVTLPAFARPTLTVAMAYALR
jgi:hypothetical protein